MFSFEHRHRHPIFHFHSYQYKFETSEKLIVSYDFEIERLGSFKPQLEINFPTGFKNNLSPEYYCHLAFQYGLVEMISYWKATCSPLIRVHCGVLTNEQLLFWNDLFFQGLGEFRYKNQITSNIKDFVTIECDEQEPEKSLSYHHNVNIKSLVIPIGGGKDSVVTLALLCENKLNPFLFFLNPRESSFKIAEASGVPKSNWIIAKRQIDKNLMLLNDQGYLNGHTPFSALLAFMTMFASIPLGIKHIVLSNESSAEEGNALFHGQMINHQYSKTFDFEKKFDRYAQKYLSNETKYFSFLRPLKELNIAKLFSRYSKYHPYFKSCNVGQKKDIWCGQCSKCLFVWVILSPYMTLTAMEKIFGKNLWLDSEQLDTLKELAGIKGNKPFECVGTIAEVRTALALSLKKYENQKFPLLLAAQKWGLMISEDTLNQEHLIPANFMEMLTHELAK